MRQDRAGERGGTEERCGVDTKRLRGGVGCGGGNSDLIVGETAQRGGA